MNGRARHVYLPRFDCLIRDHYFLFAVRGLIIVNLELLGVGTYLLDHFSPVPSVDTDGDSGGSR